MANFELTIFRYAICWLLHSDFGSKSCRIQSVMDLEAMSVRPLSCDRHTTKFVRLESLKCIHFSKTMEIDCLSLPR